MVSKSESHSVLAVFHCYPFLVLNFLFPLPLLSGSLVVLLLSDVALACGCIQCQLSYCHKLCDLLKQMCYFNCFTLAVDSNRGAETLSPFPLRVDSSASQCLPMGEL